MLRVITLSLCAAFALSACQTIQGIGKDIESGGKKIEEATKKKSGSGYDK